MKTTQIRTEEGRSTQPDASVRRPASGDHQATANIEGVLRQSIREDSRRSAEK